MLTLPRSYKRNFPSVVAAWQYADAVTRGTIEACAYVKRACQRQLDDLDRSPFAYEFDAAEAQKVCAYIETLPHVKGEWAARGERLRLEPWQLFPLTTVFGWRRREDSMMGQVLIRAGTRRFRTSYEEVPRKNGKTLIAAAVGLYMLQEDGEAGAEVYSIATTRKQARHVFDAARTMARRATALDVRAHNINDIGSASKFEPLHAQGETLDGYNISCALNDELHAWSRRRVYDVIETAMGARAQPLMFDITTAGDNLEGICFELRGYVLRVLDGTLQDDSVFGIVYTIDDADKEHWLEPAVWKKANPNWGVSVYPLDMEAMARKAREVPSEQGAFLTKRLNVWQNASVAWMDMMSWARGMDAKLRIESFAGEDCYLGIDLASKIDVNSLAIIFRRRMPDGREHKYCFMRHWLPEAAIKGDRFGQYDGWVRSGHMLKTPGNVVDIDMIEAETQTLMQRHKVQQLGVDPGHNSTQYSVHMAARGVMVVDVRPTVMNFSEPMKWLEAWVLDGTWHFNCPVLSWMVSNVVAHRNAKDEIYPRKENVVRKIDGVIAVLIAINRMMSQAEAPKHQIFFVG